MNTRRQFLITAPLGWWRPRPRAAASHRPRRGSSAERAAAPAATPGAPPTFGTGPVTGPPVSRGDVRRSREARAGHDAPGASASWRRRAGSASLAPLLERRTGPRKVALEPDVAPATVWTPALHRHARRARRATRSCAAAPAPTPLPASDADIAFAPVTAALALDRTEAAHRPSASRASTCSASTRSTRSCGR